MNTFITYPKGKVTKKRLIEAQKQIAQNCRNLAKLIRIEDSYASHVSDSRKDEILSESLIYADEIEKGLHNGNFTVWQRINTVLTGECLGFLPK